MNFGVDSKSAAEFFTERVHRRMNFETSHLSSNWLLFSPLSHAYIRQRTRYSFMDAADFYLTAGGGRPRRRPSIPAAGILTNLPFFHTKDNSTGNPHVTT